MSTPDLPPEALPFLREAKNLRENAMEFAVQVEVCTGPDGRSPHYIRIGEEGDRTLLSLQDAAALPPVYHFLYQGTPPLRIVGTRQYPDICEFCTETEGSPIATLSQP